MASAHASLKTAHSPEHVWALIGGFDSLPKWLPFIVESTLSEGGRLRTLKGQDGNIIVERMQTFDEQARTCTYSIEQSPFPISSYLATLRVSADGQGSLVEWFGEFTPAGISEAEANEMFQGVYEGGMQALEKALG